MAHTQSVNIRRVVTATLLLVSALTIDAQQWHTTIDISYPAEISMPLSVSDVLFVNNTVAHPDAPMGPFYTLMAASEMLEGSDYVPSVLETSQNSSGSLYRKQLLSDTQADSLMNTYNSNALIVLNQQIVHPSSECFLTEEDTYYAYTQVVAASHWTICYKDQETAKVSMRNVIYSDTLYWIVETAETPAEAQRALPNKEDACDEMCIYVGERFASRLLPQVETADRYLYDMGKDDEGMNYFTRRQWEQAIEVWSRQQANNKLSAYAAANSAVAYEILGDLGSAYAACGNALTYFEAVRSAEARQQAVNIRYYMERLQARMAR